MLHDPSNNKIADSFLAFNSGDKMYLVDVVRERDIDTSYDAFAALPSKDAHLVKVVVEM